MDWLSAIRTWLSDNEAAISAVAALKLLGVVRSHTFAPAAHKPTIGGFAHHGESTDRD
jgi:hypothetical protein